MSRPSLWSVVEEDQKSWKLNMMNTPLTMVNLSWDHFVGIREKLMSTYDTFLYFIFWTSFNHFIILSSFFYNEGEQPKKKPGRKKREPGMSTSKTCETCNLEFENNQDLLAHKRVVHPEKFHKCTICNELFLHAGFLQRHMDTHTLEKDFKCHLPAINQLVIDN